MREATNPRRKLLGVLSVVLVLAVVPGGLAGAQDFPPPFHVNSTLDEHDAFRGDFQCVSTPSGRCTLRAAIEEVNASEPRNVIIPAGVFILTLPEDINITGTQTITGEGAGKTIIDGSFAHRVFEIANGTMVYIGGVTIRYGLGGGSDVVPGHVHGGCVHNHGDLILVDSAITGCIAQTGGAFTNAGNGTAVFVNVTVARSSAATDFIIGLNNVGGGIENLGQLQLFNVTISENNASSGGGLLNRAGATVTLTNTIVAGNSFDDCSGSITSAGHNLSSFFSCLFLGPGDLNGAQAMLTPRSDSDGFTYLYALSPGSDAIDAGSNAPAECPSTDQRGVVRPLDGDGNGSAVCDIGAFEYDPTAPVVNAVLTPPPNSNGWNNTNVQVSWLTSDLESGIESTNGCGTTSLNSNTLLSGTTLTCSATNTGGQTTTRSVTVRIDKTAPTVVYSGNVGFYTVDEMLSITCTATDALSGIASTTCQDISAPGYSFPVGTTTVSATAVDRAGNTGNGSATFTIVVDAPSLGTLTSQFVTDAGVAQSMRAQLDEAAAAGLRGNLRAKAGLVRAYQNHVSAQAGKTVTASHAVILIQLAAAL